MKSPFFESIEQNQRGIVIPLLLITIVAVIMLLGLVVDLSNLYRAQMRLQRAVDGAALASARLQHNPIDNAAAQAQLEADIEEVAKRMVVAGLKAQGYQDHHIPHEPIVTFHLPSPGPPQPANPVRGPYTVVSASLTPDLYLLNLLPNFSSHPLIQASAEAEARSSIISLVLDVSGSMNQFAFGRRKIAALREAAIDFVEQLRHGRDMVALSTFSYQSTAEIAPNDYWDNSSVIDDQRDALVDRIASLSAGGRTNASEALFTGWKSIRGKVSNYPFLPCYIVFFTDGAPNISSVNWVPSAVGNSAFEQNPLPADALGKWYTYKDLGNIYTNYLYRTQATDHRTNAVEFEPFCPDGAATCNGPSNVNLADYLGLNQPISFRVPGVEGGVGDSGRLYQLFSLIDIDDDNNDDDDLNLRRLHYLTAIATADYIRSNSCTIFAIGLGQLESNFADFYQTIQDDNLPRKDYFLSRVANDPDCGLVPQATTCRDEPSNYVDTYSELANKGARRGEYYPTSDPRTLRGIFREILANIRLRLNQ